MHASQPPLRAAAAGATPLRKGSPPCGTAPLALPDPVRQRGRGRWRGGRRRSVGGRRRSVAARDLRVNELAQWVHRGAQGRRDAGGGRGRGQREGAEGRESAGGRRGWQQACESMKVEQARLSASMSAESPRLAFWASEMAYSSCFSDGAPAARKFSRSVRDPFRLSRHDHLSWHAACSLRFVRGQQRA